MKQYNFYLKVNEDGTFRKVNPIWGDSHARVRSREADRRIVRDEISEDFRFTSGEGFEEVRDGSIENLYFLDIYAIDGNTETLYFSGQFEPTDCQFDLDQEFFTVRLTARDQYTEYIEQEDTEFDLLKLGTPLTSVNYFAYPVLQLYALGSSTVLNVLPGGAYERQVERINSAIGGGVLTGELGFGQGYSIAIIPPVQGVLPDVSGVYIGTPLGFRSTYTREDGLYTLSYNTDASNDPEDPEPTFSEWTLKEAGGSSLFVQEDAGSSNPKFFNRGLTLSRIGNEEEQIVVFGMDIFARIVSRQATFNGIGGTGIVEGDQFAAGTNFQFSFPVELSSIIASAGISVIDDGLGRYAADGIGTNAGQFIDVPETLDSNGIPVIAISRNQWKDAGFYFYWEDALLNQIKDAGQEIELADAFKLSDAINSLASEIDNRLSFADTVDYSQFLFSDTNPVTGGPKLTYIIAPKSNVTSFNYDQPASKAEIKMNDIVEFLRHCFQAEIFITPDYKLRVETEQYFENGEQYDPGNPVIGVDLTAIREAKTGEAWAYLTNKFEYIKDQIPERLIFNWMDRGSDAFEGEDIIAISRYAQAGQKEERNVTRMSADLQLAISQPSGFSNEGFFVLAAIENEAGQLVVAETDVPRYGPTQNGALSFPYLHDKYYRVNMPTALLRLNGVEITAESTRPTKKQTVTTPIEPGTSAFTLGKTGLGAGLIESISENMSSKVAEIEIALGTD